jgi:hypothetical protein
VKVQLLSPGYSSPWMQNGYRVPTASAGATAKAASPLAITTARIPLRIFKSPDGRTALRRFHCRELKPHVSILVNRIHLSIPPQNKL